MMKHRNALILLVVMVWTLAAVPAYAASATTGGAPPPPPPMGLPSGICADDSMLYVVADGKIMQYQISDLSLLATLNLPKPPAPPEGAPPPPPAASQLPSPPPVGGGAHGAWIANGTLYVLAGHTVFRYSVPDLTLQAPIELPKPAPPADATSGTGR
ncbi:MAG: hypothetical protein ABFD98_13845 [Syntrophobacteraceae bacterium]|nr:hypothetical protein [Desulfobacteraceae bacterium]